MNQHIEIFCCVAEEDRSFLEKLRIQLATRQRDGDIKLWDKSQISPGEVAEKEIQRHLVSARIFLLLISPYFLADSYCYDLVLKAALERHTRGEALTIPVIVRPANYQDVDVLQDIEVLPKGGKPISSQPNEDEALWEVTKEIRKVIKRLGPQVRPDLEFEERQDEKWPSQQRSRPTSREVFPRKKISVILVLAVLIILGGGAALALFANHPGFSPIVTPTPPERVLPTSTRTPPTQQPSLKWANPPGTVDSSPTVVNGVLYFGSNDHNVYALDASTGRKKWAFPTSDEVYSSPTVDKGVLYIGSYDHNVYALDASTGQKKWAFPTGSTVASSPIVESGVLYVGSSDHNVYALDASTGQKKWAFLTGDRVYSSPTVINGVLYVASQDGNVYALDASTGQQKWVFPKGGSASSPKVFNGVLYVGAGDHNVYALDANTGHEIWTFSTGDGIYSSPTVVNGVLYFGSYDHKVYALDANTGQKKWVFQTLGVVRSSPTVQGGVLYIGSGDGSVTPDDHNLYALDASTGQQKWVFPTGGYVRCSPKVFDGVLYFGSGDGKIYALILSAS
jgi:outer membrane protein assembly factor BamB